MHDEFTDGNLFLKEFLRDKRYIYLTSVTHEFCDMTLNWLRSLKNINSDHLALVVCVDEACYKFMKSHHSACVYLNCDIESNATGEEWIENEKNFKLLALYIIFKHYDVDIILSDVDIVFLKDPIEKLLSELTPECDWLAMSDRVFVPFCAKRKQGRNLYISDDKTEIFDTGVTPQTLYGEENAGFSYIPNPTAPSRINQHSKKDKARKLSFLENFQKGSSFYQTLPKGTEEGCLQTASNKKAKQDGLNVKTLSCLEFPNGSVWNVDYIRNKIKDTCYIVHYNFCDDLDPIKVKNEKTNRMKKHKHWYLA